MNNLLRLIGRRLVALPIMVVGVSFLVFFIMSLSPIDPAYSALGETATPEALEEYRVQHGLNDPFFVQYGHYLWNMLHGDLGTYGVGTSNHVTDLVAQALPITLQLTFLGLFFAVIVAFPLGVLAALYRDRWPDQVIRVISIASLATPSFWLALLMIQWWSDVPGGTGTFPSVITEWIPFGDEGYLRQITLPAIAVALPNSGSLTRVVRTAMVEELDKDYVRTAIGAGIPKHIVVARNVLRNALITPLTVLGLRIGYAMGGAVVIEMIFNIQGMGQLIFQGITRNDVNIVQGVSITVAAAFIIINIIVDMLYVLVNPRIRSV